MSKLPCYFAHGGVNFKNGFATVCPISAERLHIIDGTTPSNFYNNKNFTQYRKLLDKGEWPAGCHLCKQAEETDKTASMRQQAPQPDLTDYNYNTGEIKNTGLKHVELRFSNACNMACMHCSEVYSSQWGSRLKNYKPDNEDRKHNLIQLLKTQHRQGPNDNTRIELKIDQVTSIVDDLINNFPNLEKIDFAGGEVLIQKQFFPCLEQLAQHPNAKKIQIFFHTNLNADFDVQKLSKLLLPFGSVKIKISVDAGKRIYSYFRDGDWSKLKENINFLKKANPKAEMDLVCTTSIYQLMDIENIFESFLSLEVHGITPSIVFTPSYINPSLINIYFKHYMIEDFKDVLRMCNNVDKQRRKRKDYTEILSYNKKTKQFGDINDVRQCVKFIQDYVSKHQSTKADWEAFIVYSKKIDSLWKKDFNKMFKYYKRTDTGFIRQRYGKF